MFWSVFDVLLRSFAGPKPGGLIWVCCSKVGLPRRLRKLSAVGAVCDVASGAMPWKVFWEVVQSVRSC